MNGGGPVEEPAEIEQEIHTIRDHLTELVSELDRRRHEVLDWRLQIRRHRREIAIGVGVVALLVVGGFSLRAALRRRRAGPLAHGQKLAHALRLIASEPEALERAIDRERSHPGRTALGALTGAGGTLLRAGATRAIANSD